MNEKHIAGSKSSVTIRGLVIPAAWDENGKVTGVHISTYDEKQYFVESNEHLDELLQLIGQETEINGEVRHEGRKNFLKPHHPPVNTGRTGPLPGGMRRGGN
jgi:hypothetical protein